MSKTAIYSGTRHGRRRNAIRNHSFVRSFSTNNSTSQKEKIPDYASMKRMGLNKLFVSRITSDRISEVIEKWNTRKFYGIGIGGISVSTIAVITSGVNINTSSLCSFVACYWAIGLLDIAQPHHAIRRNFPILGHLRYFLESIGPEIRQYFVESRTEAEPFSQNQRATVYRRAKNVDDTLAFGTRKDVYEEGYEWINHSLFPTKVNEEHKRVTIGGKDCKQPYSSSRLNISGMSYGAISENAILALNTAAKSGSFYHNTGEGGVSRFHDAPGGDIVWNIGTGYFGCRDSKTHSFDPAKFRDQASRPNIKMIEIKLSQGAKPAHGGMLPGSKVTEAIAEARGIQVGETCYSPPYHSAFSTVRGLLRFIVQLRELSGGKPIGIKLCMGKSSDVAAIVAAMLDMKVYPDFITIDGGEGGTGAAPNEFSNHVGWPLVDALMFVNNLLLGTGLREELKIIASGKILSGFSMLRTTALGADVMNSARAFMFALGCIQSLKCNTNKCPTGITTQDPMLMYGLDISTKW